MQLPGFSPIRPPPHQPKPTKLIPKKVKWNPLLKALIPELLEYLQSDQWFHKNALSNMFTVDATTLYKYIFDRNCFRNYYDLGQVVIVPRVKICDAAGNPPSSGAVVAPGFLTFNARYYFVH